MRSAAITTLLAGLAFSTLACSGADTVTSGVAGAGAVAATGANAEKVARIDALFAEWDNPGSPGCAVGVIHEGELVFTRGYGSANLDYQIPLDARSVFYIASTSKQFTAAAVARLVLDGEVSLDDNVRDYIPELPDLGLVVTVRNLIHHTSGIRDYLTLMEMSAQSFEDFFDNGDAIRMLARQKALNFEPGDEFLYSNSNYVLLAELVERVSGQSLQEFSREHFFGPLGMDATHWGEDRTAVIPNRVVGYLRNDDGSHRRFLKNFHGKGDGNLLTTIEDLARWDAMFYSEDEPWASLVEFMLTPGELTNGETLDYAFGLVHTESMGLSGVRHSGGFLGFRTQMTRFPSEAFTAICLCNLGSIDPGLMAARITDAWLFDGQGVAAPTPVATPEVEAWEPGAELLAAYAGDYYSSSLDLIYALAPTEGGLALRIDGRSSFELRPMGEDTFGLEGTPLRLRFSPDFPTIDGFTAAAGRGVRGIRFERR